MRRPLGSRGLPALAVLLAAGCAPATVGEAGDGSSQLVILIAVDQFPTYLFQRYDSLYRGGLRRLLTEGRYYTQAAHNHAETWTSSGHATLATGMEPMRHGIVANRWWERVGDGWRLVESVDDAAERVVSVPHKVGFSPRNLRASGLGDWVVAADPDARVVSLSGKRTAATLMVGRTRRAYVYYFEDDAGRFVTSTYYRERDPGWVARFNERTLPRLLADSVWECTVPPGLRRLARRDTVPYEGDGRHTYFPHRFREEAGGDADATAFYDWWDHTPALDAATVALAEEAVSALALGQRGHVDYLALGLSQLDRVGHAYGPLSLEQLDAVLRLDGLLGELFEYLDAKVGAGRYVVALSSDHGSVQIPAYRREIGLPGRRLRAAEWRAVRERAARVAARAGPPSEARAAIAAELERLDFIADVITLDELESVEPADSFVALYRRSYHPNRVRGRLARQGLWLRLNEGTHGEADPAYHGSAYLYDRAVPLIILGPGVEPGVSDEPVRTADVAPTLARLAGIAYPEELDGRALLAAR